MAGHNTRSSAIILTLVVLLVVPGCSDNSNGIGPGDGELAEPHLFFGTVIRGVWDPYVAGGSSMPADTVGMYQPFSITYHGESDNGPIAAYRFDVPGLIVPGEGVWSEDVSDTIRAFPNTGTAALPSGYFALIAQCRDVEGEESDSTLCSVVVNFDPDTRIDAVISRFERDGIPRERAIDFTDSEPDTVPYRSWVQLRYGGWDDERDGMRCSPTNPDRCINFQLKYDRISARIQGSFGTSGWVPRGAAHDSDTLSAADSNSVNIGTVEYDFYVRAVDENRRADGTPANVHIVGNYDPTLTNVTFEDHFGHLLDIDGVVVDTLTWNFWRGVGWPYASTLDTVDVFDPDVPYIKHFQWRMRAGGHDHPDDPPGSGIKAWRYLIHDENGNFWPLARAGQSWLAGDALNSLDDTFELTVRYPSCLGEQASGVPGDPCGNTVFDNLPGYLGHDLTVTLVGRDTNPINEEFDQYMFLSAIPTGSNGQGLSEKTLINSYPSAAYGRYTEEKMFTFHLRLVRDPVPDPADCNCE